MACSSMTISSSSFQTTSKDHIKEQKNLGRSHSAKDLYCRAGLIRRSRSDHHLCYSVNRLRTVSMQLKPKNNQENRVFSFHLPDSILPGSIRSFLADLEISKDMQLVESDEVENEVPKNRANWVEIILKLRSRWRNSRQEEESVDNRDGDANDNDKECGDGWEGVCQADYSAKDKEGEPKEIFDAASFSRLLAEVPSSAIKMYSKLAFLCNMAYVIPEIKAVDLRKCYNLHFVTSSLEKKAEASAIKSKLEQDSIRIPFTDPEDSETDSAKIEEKRLNRPFVAYDIAASAASYVHSQAEDLSGSHQESNDVEARGCGAHLQEEEGFSPSRVHKSEMAAYVAASTMTAVVAAGEEEKQKAARDLQSLHSSPCEWFICDDLSAYTRCFVIQGSDSLASWQANLFFEPSKFEGTDVLVHRGIYEAAKGIYEQFKPAIDDHLNSYGDRAKLQFTGHSLGGSLSLLVNLMLLARKAVKPSALLPVVTFGSPFVFCGGQKLLDELGLDDSHIHCVMMHRDIVPRAFSCNYPNHVAQLLKRLNGTFRSHPCLNKNKLLYSPMGKLFILQPDEKSSPPHPLLPPGNALYTIEKIQYGIHNNALRTFLNSPHPLETLSDPTAYGSEGTILRDHDSSNYLKAVNAILRKDAKPTSSKVSNQGNHLWPLLISPSPHTWNHEGSWQDSRLLVK